MLFLSSFDLIPYIFETLEFFDLVLGDILYNLTAFFSESLWSVNINIFASYIRYMETRLHCYNIKELNYGSRDITSVGMQPVILGSA